MKKMIVKNTSCIEFDALLRYVMVFTGKFHGWARVDPTTSIRYCIYGGYAGYQVWLGNSYVNVKISTAKQLTKYLQATGEADLNYEYFKFNFDNIEFKKYPKPAIIRNPL